MLKDTSLCLLKKKKKNLFVIDQRNGVSRTQNAQPRRHGIIFDARTSRSCGQGEFTPTFQRRASNKLIVLNVKDLSHTHTLKTSATSHSDLYINEFSEAD